MLGVPCLRLRENTERPITKVTNQVVGQDPETVIAAAEHVLREGVPARRPPLWDGLAGERIAEVLTGPSTPRRRPTDLA